ncbi:deoxyribonuclease V [Tahibacter harae]|uniref:Endonuclease V n=1 Tax=Tahibacter harae TaxID=2963937 RepID=A0ABT1QZ85_9GAMM|nr:deoxyribonuclease V [Tahibacter harae]MCQ4167602.1 deoxyribonuclease V [Tahibacter harae]
MRAALEHAWTLDAAQAPALQRQLAARVERSDRHAPLRSVTGVDVAYAKDGDRLIAAAVTLDLATLAVIEQAVVEDRAQFPYIPGLFSFRELPPLAKALQQLRQAPEVIVCDGHGYAHPRRFGLACHIGVLFDIPALGCGKTLLTGTLREPLPAARGAQAALYDGEEIIGAALRTQDGTRPVYVSVGHRLSLQSGCALVLRLCRDFRLPETTRAADQLVKRTLGALPAGAAR